MPRRKTTTSTKEVAFEPLQGDKLADGSVQSAFHTMFQAMTPEQKQGASTILNAIVDGTFKTESGAMAGYRGIMRFWRQYRNLFATVNF